MEKQPESRLQQVMVLGMWYFNLMLFYGFQGERLLINGNLDQINA